METDTFLDKIPDDLNDLYLTILTPDGTSTFARDNAEHFNWFLVQLAKLNNPDRKWDAIVFSKATIYTAQRHQKQGCLSRKYRLAALKRKASAFP